MKIEKEILNGKYFNTLNYDHEILQIDKFDEINTVLETVRIYYGGVFLQSQSI